MSTTPQKGSVAVEMRGITKSFGELKALDGVNLKVKFGEVHAILGENGAGKSTLMSILFGLKHADRGEIYIRGERARINNVEEATRLGIGMVHQHFRLVQVFSVYENIILGHEDSKMGFLKRKDSFNRIKELSERYGMNLDLKAQVKDIPVSAQQKTEIMKVLYVGADIIILDEPTAVLTPQEIDSLMEVIKRFAAEGKAVILITHKLNEIKQVADVVTLLRRGRTLGTFNVKDCSTNQLAELMVGRPVSFTVDKKDLEPGETVLSVRDLSCLRSDKSKLALDGVSFDVHAGEIVGIASIEGNGETELMDLVTGLKSYPKQSGKILFKGRSVRAVVPEAEAAVEAEGTETTAEATSEAAEAPVESTEASAPETSEVKEATEVSETTEVSEATEAVEAPQTETYPEAEVQSQPEESEGIDLLGESVKKRIQMGMSDIPADRQKYGLFLDMNIADNLISRHLSAPFTKLGFLLPKVRDDHADKLIEEYDIRSNAGHSSVVGDMSGGNQQKVIIAREMEEKPALLVSNQATRGLDVGAIEFVNSQIIKARDAGCAVLLYSTELEDLFNLSTVILVLHEGKIVARLDPKTTDYREVGLYMGGGNLVGQAQPEAEAVTEETEAPVEAVEAVEASKPEVAEAAETVEAPAAVEVSEAVETPNPENESVVETAPEVEETTEVDIAPEVEAEPQVEPASVEEVKAAAAQPLDADPEIAAFRQLVRDAPDGRIARSRLLTLAKSLKNWSVTAAALFGITDLRDSRRLARKLSKFAKKSDSFPVAVAQPDQPVTAPAEVVEEVAEAPVEAVAEAETPAAAPVEEVAGGIEASVADEPEVIQSDEPADEEVRETIEEAIERDRAASAVALSLKGTTPESVQKAATARAKKKLSSHTGRLASGVLSFLDSVGAILVGLVLGFLVMLLTKVNDPGAAVQGFVSLFTSGARSGISSVGHALWVSAPLILVGLAVALPNKAGLFNIGGSGQFTIAASVTMLVINVAPIANAGLFWLALIVAMFTGMCWAGIAGLLKATLNVNEVVCTIMLNWISVFLNIMVVNMPEVWNNQLAAANYNVPAAFVPSAGLGSLFGYESGINSSIIFALVAAIIIFVLVYGTRFGFKVRSVGLSRDASKYAGYSYKKITISVMCIAGLMSGMAAIFYYIPSAVPSGYSPLYQGLLQSNQTLSNMGFDGISVALIANNNPLGVILSGAMLGWLREASTPIQNAGFDKNVVDLVMGVIIYSSAAVKIVSMLVKRYKLHRIVKAEEKEQELQAGKEAA